MMKRKNSCFSFIFYIMASMFTTMKGKKDYVNGFEIMSIVVVPDKGLPTKLKSKQRNESEYSYKSLDQQFNRQLRAVLYNRHTYPLQKKARVQRAEDMLLDAVDEYFIMKKSPDAIPIIRPNRYHFAMVIDGWAKSNYFHAAQRAEDLLLQMISLFQSRNDESYAVLLKPDRVVFSTVIKAWARSGQASKAECWLLYMEDEYNILPDSRAYTSVIHAWVKAQEKERVLGTIALERAEELLELMQQRYVKGENMSCKPDTYTYNTILHGYAQSDHLSAPYKAEILLQRMEEMDVKPDLVSYTSVIITWSKNIAYVEGAPYRAEELLKEVVRRYESGDTEMKPDVIIYNAVIDSWAKSGNNISASRANDILKAMETGEVVEPDSITYASVVDCYSKSNLQNAGYKAEMILNRMITRYDSGSHQARPTVYVFTAVIDCWSKCLVPEAPKRAEQILKRMEARYRAGDRFSKPNIYTYSSLMDVWARSKDDNSYRRVEEIFELIKSMYESGDNQMEPNVVTFSLFMKALLKCKDKHFASLKADEILDIMLLAFKDGNKSMRPSKVTMRTAFLIWSQDPLLSSLSATTKTRLFLRKLKEAN